MRKLLLLVSILMLNAILGNAGEENQDQDIAKTVEALKQIKMETTVPEAARLLLTTLKHQLRDLIQNSLKTTNDAANAQTSVINELKKQKALGENKANINKADDDTSYIYGDIIDISIKAVDNHPDMIAATTTIGVCCGRDTSLYLFKKSGLDWNLILAQESNGYAEVSGAQDNFAYAVSPTYHQQNFFIVIKNVTPTCIGSWLQIRYMALRPGTTAYGPKVLLKQSEISWLGDETDESITIKPSGFTIGFIGEQELNIAGATRKHVVAYKVDGDQVTRIAPLAKEPEGFLDEWFNLPWSDASKWIAGTELADISNWHARMHTERSDPESDHFHSEFIYSPPACRISDKQWQIGIEFHAWKGKSLPLGMPEKAYFTVAQNDNGDYVIKDVAKTGARKCRTK